MNNTNTSYNQNKLYHSGVLSILPNIKKMVDGDILYKLRDEEIQGIKSRIDYLDRSHSDTKYQLFINSPLQETLDKLADKKPELYSHYKNIIALQKEQSRKQLGDLYYNKIDTHDATEILKQDIKYVNLCKILNDNYIDLKHGHGKNTWYSTKRIICDLVRVITYRNACQITKAMDTEYNKYYIHGDLDTKISISVYSLQQEIQNHFEKQTLDFFTKILSKFKKDNSIKRKVIYKNTNEKKSMKIENIEDMNQIFDSINIPQNIPLLIQVCDIFFSGKEEQKRKDYSIYSLYKEYYSSNIDKSQDLEYQSIDKKIIQDKILELKEHLFDSNYKSDCKMLLNLFDIFQNRLLMFRSVGGFIIKSDAKVDTLYQNLFDTEDKLLYYFRQDKGGYKASDIITEQEQTEKYRLVNEKQKSLSFNILDKILVDGISNFIIVPIEEKNINQWGFQENDSNDQLILINLLENPSIPLDNNIDTKISNISVTKQCLNTDVLKRKL